ncbi:MAG: type II toxin-antitoxin system death-on-curing family toxin [Acidobacteriota bacterium]
MDEPVWVRTDVVLAIHQRQLTEHGGTQRIRDEGLLASTLAKPKHLLACTEPPPDLAALAAAYGYGIARNHPFIDGNKRTALVVCRTFLKLNGSDLITTQEEKYRAFLDLAASQTTEADFAAWIRVHLPPQEAR